MSEYTKGPWAVNDGEYCGSRIDASNGRSVAHAIQRDPHPTIGQGISQAEAQANARLISAAPELLAALKSIVASADLSQAAVNGFLLIDAREAIAKATQP